MLVKKVKTDGSFTILENVNNDPNGFGLAQAFDKVDVAKGFFNDKDVTKQDVKPLALAGGYKVHWRKPMNVILFQVG